MSSAGGSGKKTTAGPRLWSCNRNYYVKTFAAWNGRAMCRDPQGGYELGPCTSTGVGLLQLEEAKRVLSDKFDLVLVSVGRSVCLSACLSICRSIRLSICPRKHARTSKKNEHTFGLSYLSLSEVQLTVTFTFCCLSTGMALVARTGCVVGGDAVL